MSLMLLAFFTSLLAQANPGAASQEATAIASLKRANEQLRLNTCAAVEEANRLLNEALGRGGAEASRYGQLTAHRIERKREILECKGEQEPGAKPETRKSGPKTVRAKATATTTPALAPAAKRTFKTGEKAKATTSVVNASSAGALRSQIIWQDYLAAKNIATRLADDCNTMPAAERLACVAELRLARELQADLALDALGALSERDSQWASVRKDLLVMWAGDQNMQDLLRYMQEKLSSGEVSESEARTALDTPHEKLELAMALSRAGGSAEVWDAFIKRVQGVLPEESRRALAANRPVDWVAVFAHLQNLSDEKWEVLKTRMEGMRIWNPHPRSDQIGLLYMVAEPDVADAAAHFLNAFTPWMQRLSPQGAGDPEIWRGRYTPADLEGMLGTAQTELSRKESSSCRQQTLPTEPSIGEFLDRFLCGSRAGFVVVELAREGARIKATTSWVVRLGGGQVSADRRGTSTTFPMAARPQDVKEIEITQTQVGHEFAELLIFQKGVFPHLVEFIAQLKKLKCEKCEVPKASPWHALLFAGTPFIENDRSSPTVRYLFSALDVLTLGGGIAFLASSVRARNDSATGSGHDLSTANAYLTTSAALLGSTLLIRLLATGCYAADWCRGDGR